MGARFTFALPHLALCSQPANLPSRTSAYFTGPLVVFETAAKAATLPVARPRVAKAVINLTWMFMNSPPSRPQSRQRCLDSAAVKLFTAAPRVPRRSDVQSALFCEEASMQNLRADAVVIGAGP